MHALYMRSCVPSSWALESGASTYAGLDTDKRLPASEIDRRFGAQVMLAVVTPTYLTFKVCNLISPRQKINSICISVRI